MALAGSPWVCEGRHEKLTYLDPSRAVDVLHVAPKLFNNTSSFMMLEDLGVLAFGIQSSNPSLMLTSLRSGQAPSTESPEHSRSFSM